MSPAASSPARPSNPEPLYAFIRRHRDSESGRLADSSMELPDGAWLFRPDETRWVAGGLDGMLVHHSAAEGDDATAARIAELVAAIARDGAAEPKHEIYQLLARDGVIGFLDGAIERIAAARVPTDPHVRAWLREVATTAPDRGPVKFALALLGLMATREDGPILLTFALHDEFTLFAAVAIGNALENPERTFYFLARCVTGWGRIHLVERLAGTSDPEIKRSLLAWGFRNDVMNGYLTHLCATTGELHAALAPEVIDDDLFHGASALLLALIAGGPARDINDYDRAAAAISRYLHHAARWRLLEVFGVVLVLREYLADPKWDSAARQDNGWTDPLRAACRAQADAYLAAPEWPDRAVLALASEDDEIFAQGDRAARALGIDTWDAHARRVEERPFDPLRWHGIAQRADQNRIAALLMLAEQKLPLARLASGPAEEQGTGPEFREQACLGHVVRALEKFPGQGSAIILTALRSPVIGNRQLAVHTLKAWPAGAADPEIDAALARALREEPSERVKPQLAELVASRRP